MNTPNSATSGRTALVIDDDPETQQLMVRALRQIDVVGVGVLDGETALTWLAAHPPPDLIIMDLLLPRMSGFELGRKIRADERLANVPLMVTTARENLQDEELALELSAAFLTKPFRVRDYLSTLQDLMKNGDKGPPVVMVVDDDADILKTLAAIFREEGFETLVAMNGVEALFLLSQRPRPALIVLDLMMPEMDGIELAERLGSDKQLSTIPLLLFSANDHVAEHARTLGAVGHIAKPADLDKLLGLVHGAIDTSARRRA